MHKNRDIAKLCANLGIRMTRPRRAIIGVIMEATDHPDVMELHRRVNEVEPGISVATVYRTVRLLEEGGVLKSHTFGANKTRYEIASQGHHDHLIDVDTGEVVEFRSDEIERLQEEIAHQHGFEIVGHRLEIYVRPLGEDSGDDGD